MRASYSAFRCLPIYRAENCVQMRIYFKAREYLHTKKRANTCLTYRCVIMTATATACLFLTCLTRSLMPARAYLYT